MKRLILYCAVSAMFGGAIATWLLDSHTILVPTTVAQELRAPAGGASIVPAAIPPNPNLTPEELTNI
ncbi:MAG TPA: hypothetical protein VFW73_09765, partial [Lacipirellulaceae bacterium]|nr:hypothetical protein [Lacipirellulaceae bacterium]